MNAIAERLEDLITEEEDASGEYVEFANDLYESGFSKSDAAKVINIARDERRHFEILKSLLRKIQ